MLGRDVLGDNGGVRWLAVVYLTGCNQVFGLDETVATATDRDDDGLLDVIDNCVDVANPRQENQDDDALGDACDPCLVGSNEDEDSDALLDGCDSCPHVANADQANVDGDDLGDACDHDNQIEHTRVRFDGFATLTLDWIFGFVEWETVDGSARITAMPPSDDMGMWNRRIEVTGKSWLIETAVTPGATGGFAGLLLRERIGTTEYPCYVEYDGGWTLHTVGVTRALPSLLSEPIRIRLRKGATTMTCEIVGVDSVTFPENDTRTGVGLYTSSPAALFHYVEAVSGG
jgi:hypothetical protein